MTLFYPGVRDMVHRHWDEKYAQTIGSIDTTLLKYHPRQQMVGWSGGKDSTVILYLIKKECEDFGIDFHDIVIMSPSLVARSTGAIEYPETHEFCQSLATEWNLNIVETVSHISFWDFVEARGLPAYRGSKNGRLSNCCYTLKILPMIHAMRGHGTKCLYLGTTAPESHQRQMKAIQFGQSHLIRKWKVTQVLPILYWTEEEVWRFIRSENIPYNKIYDKGVTRCGCASCTAYRTWESDMSRLVPEVFARILKFKGGKVK